ncbi:DUF2254 domain-containing protein [Terrihabitans rhizophilus]|uniref:DUF2254 domain-containing protein n=1 Tax=Terrihabitans rhizophilus TaxID=3092662 RepID=A0ABU4RLG2_9HYPH|nr:DUF2254 domain-containing protein [Terrihabitans sp. PJ23]MDX6805679.1 DUF2254 domain-containing protein [Terrihabitans sp. PJ23]
MYARSRAWLEELGDQFWLRPALVVTLCILLAVVAVQVTSVPGLDEEIAQAWGYSGGAEGARALLGAIASSSIGVAGTVFSITIAALSLASGQMGPRLLRNFVRDARNQLALGIFIGTFAYSLVVLRTVRTVEEQPFVPHLAVSGAILLAILCTATLVWFVHHIAASINVENVISSVHDDLNHAVTARTLDEAEPEADEMPGGVPVRIGGNRYLLAVDADGLANWAEKHGVVVSLTVRPGDYVPKGISVARVHPPQDDAEQALQNALTFGARPVALQDIEFYIRQLTEIAVRALSPGTNDPFTAASVVERLGDTLCQIAGRHLPTGMVRRGDTVSLLQRVSDYQGICDAMFDIIRQNASGSAFVLIRLLEVLTMVCEVEDEPARRQCIREHAELALEEGLRSLQDRDARADLEERWAMFNQQIGASA